VASTFSSCVEQPIQRLFFALAAANKVYGGDATNAFANSPPPDTPTFVQVDEAYAEWYEDRFGTVFGRHLVLPVLHTLQGHPESGRLWETKISAIVSHSTLAFKLHPSRLMPLTAYTNLPLDQWRVHPNMPPSLHHMGSSTSHYWASSSTHISHADLRLATPLSLFPHLALPLLPSIFPVSKISQDLLTPNVPMICAIADRPLV
jgi:hypothetical protein